MSPCLAFLLATVPHLAPMITGPDAEPIVKKVIAESQLPAMAMSIIKDGTVASHYAEGMRLLGSDEKVTVSDVFHLGSCTKSMTATLAAILVREGKLKWTTTISEAFPKLKTSPKLQRVSLKQLLMHRSGLRADLYEKDMEKYMHTTMPPTEQRKEVMSKLLAEEPESVPDSQYSYANLGYATAGAMMEQICKKPWETLLKEKVFDPLKMTTAGFGPPASKGMVDQPWGHLEDKGDYVAVPPGPDGDNPAAIGPAGTVHCNILDLEKYVISLLEASRGESKLLTKDEYETITSDPYKQTYGMGWIVIDRDWAGGKAITHAGSNTMFTTLIWIAPKKNLAFIVMTNAGGAKAMKACDTAVVQAIGQL